MDFFDVKPYVKKFNNFLVLRDLTYNIIKSYNSMLFITPSSDNLCISVISFSVGGVFSFLNQ